MKFAYSNTNKRYHTWNHYLKQHFHQRVCKIPLNAGFSCPNRDGTVGYGGCTFCGSMGSGDFAGHVQEDLSTQFAKGSILQRQKFPNAICIPYFQAFTNTHAPLSVLRSIYTPFLNDPSIPMICIATRCDCLSQEIIDFFQSYTNKKEVWLEIGLQSVHDTTAQHIHRGHTMQQFLNCFDLLRKTDIKISIHLINALPYENDDMMMETIQEVVKLPIHAIKIHMLHIMEGSAMADDYKQHPFPLLSKEEYVNLIVRQLEYVPANIIIQRLTGDGDKQRLIAPIWTMNKLSVLNEIDKEMQKRNTWQGKNTSSSL